MTLPLRSVVVVVVVVVVVAVMVPRQLPRQLLSPLKLLLPATCCGRTYRLPNETLL